MQNHWQNEHNVDTPALNDDEREWLLYRASMTARLKTYCKKDFEVDVIRHQWATPTTQDGQYLQLTDQQDVIEREVILYCDHRPWMYARTIIPQATVNNVQVDLLNLGARPIGEVLFADPNMTRSDFDLAYLTQGNALHDQAINLCDQADTPLWARRSIFNLPEQGKLAITEVFMPICWLNQEQTLQS